MIGSGGDDGIKTVTTGSRDNSITLVLALCLLAVFAGIVGGVLGGAVAYLFNAIQYGKFIIGGIAFGLSAAFVFSFFKLFYLIEMWFGIDLNGDGHTGPPEPPPFPAPETKYLTPVSVHDDPENRLNARYVNLETKQDDTLQRMAVILAVRGWSYFTAEHFTDAKSETQLMTYDHWQKVFLPGMVAARLVSTTTDSRGRNRVELTEMGKEMMTKLAGAMDRAAAPAPAMTYAQDVSTPYPRLGVLALSRRRKQRNH